MTSSLLVVGMISEILGEYLSNKNGYRQTDRQTETGDNFFSYFRGHDMSRKYESGNSAGGLDYYTSLAYAREVKINTSVDVSDVNQLLLSMTRQILVSVLPSTRYL